MVDTDTAKQCNMLSSSPTFALKFLDDGSAELAQPPIIPNDGHGYAVAGESQLPAGLSVPSVFVVEGGGSYLVKVYWLIQGKWHEPSDAEVPGLLGHTEKGLFPFEWSYAIPVENDAYH